MEHVPKRRRLSAKARRAAPLDASGELVSAICARVPCSRDFLMRMRKRDDYRALVQRHEADLRAAADGALAAARPGIIATLRTAAEGGDVKAATALLQASQPPSERQRQQARLEVLRMLTPTTRALVMRELDDAGAAWARDLSDDEIDRRLSEVES